MKQFKLSMIIATIAFSISSCSNKRQAQTEPEAIAPFNISKAEMLSDKCDTITATLSQEDYALMIDLIESGITELLSNQNLKKKQSPPILRIAN